MSIHSAGDNNYQEKQLPVSLQNRIYDRRKINVVRIGKYADTITNTH
ncbi:MAG: hypothetical protein ACTS8R_05140 [Arsenophonus sp. NC-QC1-MAG3]